MATNVRLFSAGGSDFGDHPIGLAALSEGADRTVCMGDNVRPGTPFLGAGYPYVNKETSIPIRSFQSPIERSRRLWRSAISRSHVRSGD